MRGTFVYSAEGRLNTKLQRQKEFAKSPDSNAVPKSYQSNTTKEELCLEYINSFTDQFSSIYKARREPFIAAENEHGVRKLVCTTLRPTLLPIPELYDMYECASFLAGYILYEPLDPATEPPQYLFSPAQVLESHTGDCFDMSNVLCSFLLGAGYDAYMVMGYAPTFITLKDQTLTTCPLIKETLDSMSNQVKEASSPNEADEPNSFVPPDNTVKNSKFIADIAEKKRLAAIDTFQLWVPEAPLDEAKMMEEERNKASAEQLVHCWVLVKAGRRDVKENLFIEASTGRVYTNKTCPYIGVESAWNHLNYFVNTKTNIPPADLDFDFKSEAQWEPLFLSKADTSAKSQKNTNAEDNDLMEQEGPESEAKEDVVDDSLRLFDAPPCWSIPLSLPRTKFLLKFPPSGKRSVQYYCAKADFFARNISNQSMVMRITLYLDKACTIVNEIHEWFEIRADHLYKRVRYFLGQRRFVEYFTPGSRGEVKKWTEYPGKSIEVDYYVNGRLDRLVRREEIIGQSITEHFQNRIDFMTYRAVLLTSERGPSGSRHFILPATNLGPEQYITRMTIIYDHDPSVNDGSDIAKRIFNVREGKAVFYFHFSKGQITGAVKTYLHTRGPSIPVLSDQALAQESGLDDDPDALQEAAALERENFSAIKASFQLHDKLTEGRLDGEVRVEIERSVFERALDSVDNYSGIFNADDTAGFTKENKGTDYLTPFLRSIADPAQLTKEEALAIRQACLDALKARLVERANIIQTKLHEENAKLGKKQELFQRSQREGDFSTEEYEEYCTKAMFRIQILEQRLSTHEETALRKFAELDLKLSNDPRLRVLKN